MKTLFFPHPPVRHALLQGLDSDRATRAFVDALNASGNTGQALRLAYPLRLSLRLLDAMAQENLEFALLQSLKAGRGLDQGLDLEWRWTLWSLLGLLTVCRDTPEELAHYSAVARELLGHFQTQPMALDELLGLLREVADAPTVWPGFNLEAGGHAPALAQPCQQRPFWEHLVFQLTSAHKCADVAGELHQTRRWRKALMAIQRVRLEEETALPKAPESAARVVMLHHRRQP